MNIRFSFCFNLLKFQNKTNGSSENSLYINHGTLMKIIYNNKSSKYNTIYAHFFSLFFRKKKQHNISIHLAEKSGKQQTC